MSISAMKQALEALDSDDPSIQLRAALALRQAIEMSEKNVRVSDKWVGLTDEEVFDIYKQFDSLQYKSFAKAIEAKLKELNA
jgi:hypothetical protein